MTPAMMMAAGGIMSQFGHQTFDSTSLAKSSSLLPSNMMQVKNSFDSQTISSQYRTQQTNKSFAAMGESRRLSLNRTGRMPDLSNTMSKEDQEDLTVDQIVQLGKSRHKHM